MDDLYELNRFMKAQLATYDSALAEERNGTKVSHWMWYIFPQFEGLGHSPMATRYSIKSIAEAEAYLAHPVLGQRLAEVAHAALDVKGRSAREIFGTPDDLKLKSSATLFANVATQGSVFHALLDKYFNGRVDERTMQLLGKD